MRILAAQLSDNVAKVLFRAQAFRCNTSTIAASFHMLETCFFDGHAAACGAVDVLENRPAHVLDGEDRLLPLPNVRHLQPQRRFRL